MNSTSRSPFEGQTIGLIKAYPTAGRHSLPRPPPFASGTRPAELHVYTIEQCQSCGQKTKRDFKMGDYVQGKAGTCEKCQGERTIILIYGEKISQ